MIASPGLRVLHVGKYYPPKMGGIEIHLEALCGELRQHLDLEVVVANDSWRGRAGMVNGIKVTRVGTLFNMANAPVCPGMVRKIREAGADIVHIHFPNPNAILAYLASGHRGRLVVTYHSDIVRQKLLGWTFWPFLRRALDRSAALIATSSDYVETSPVLSAYRDRCRVIPYGIAVERFQRCNGATVAGIREQYGPRIVISVGRLVYYKGFEYLIRAMAGVTGKLLIVGDGPLRADLQREARARGVSDRVVFLGEMDNHDIIPYYHAAEVFALASIARSEAFGIVQLEAMACGKPVVNTRLASGVPFVSVDGLTGLTVPPANPEALAKAINLLLDDPGRRAEYGHAARRRVQQEFSLQKVGHRTLQLYSDVMNSQVKSGDDWIHVGSQAGAIWRKDDVNPVIVREGLDLEYSSRVDKTLPVRPPLLKRPFDLFLSSLGLLFSAPLWPLIAIGIKLDDGGQVLYGQKRVGKGGKRFTNWKFRTMIADSDEQFGPLQARDGDSRVTRVGRILRGTALDEMPQLWNIFKGDMSFVGPRALVPEEIEVHGDGELVPLEKIPGYEERHRVRPGLTGVAQVYAPRYIRRSHKFRFDLLYIKKRTFWLDLKLIALSFWITFRGRWEHEGKKF